MNFLKDMDYLKKIFIEVSKVTQEEIDICEKILEPLPQNSEKGKTLDIKLIKLFVYEQSLKEKMEILYNKQKLEEKELEKIKKYKKKKEEKMKILNKLEEEIDSAFYKKELIETILNREFLYFLSKKFKNKSYLVYAGWIIVPFEGETGVYMPNP